LAQVSPASSGLDCWWGLWHVPHTWPWGSSSGIVTMTRMAWQLRHASALGSTAAAAAATSPASLTGSLYEWQARQWIVNSPIPPNRMVLSEWHPDCVQVSVTGVN
jgi:hypothetical protein